MHIQPMSVIRLLRKTSLRLNTCYSGVSIGMLHTLLFASSWCMLLHSFRGDLLLLSCRILVAAITVCERVGDTFISWVPMYSEAKLAFFVYLWYPKTKGTAYVYDSFFKPYVAKHENEIDRNLLELRTRAGDMAILYWQRAASYSQTRIFEVLQYIAAQSTPRRRPAQPKEQGPRRTCPVPASDGQPSRKDHIDTEEPTSPTSSISSSQDQKEVSELEGPSNSPTAAPSVSCPVPPKSSTTPAETSTQSLPAEVEAQPPDANENSDPPPALPPKETILEETLPRTRRRLRKA
ncbi:hypothetical protein SAY86_010753 [Trapa natans]|uniref:HVA22-like protein n=1 Tax=Trapa natans TaxID=22666 RepID=A0AAN7R3K3_TRANT|nr:hypothetical protein SAY86_010753 [Trapa natans]